MQPVFFLKREESQWLNTFNSWQMSLAFQGFQFGLSVQNMWVYQVVWDMTTESFAIVAVCSVLCCHRLSVAWFVLMFASKTLLQAKFLHPFQSVREGQSLSSCLTWLCISLLQDQQVAYNCNCENEDEIRPWQSRKHNSILLMYVMLLIKWSGFGCTWKCNF